MRWKPWLFAIFAGLLGTACLYLLTDWLTPKHIQIIAESRPGWGSVQRVRSPVSFLLNGSYRLTRVRVVPLPLDKAASAQNPVWELSSSSNSLPVQGFSYGQRLRGMKASDSLRQPSPLVPSTSYRLFVEAGREKGQVDFTVR
jgi:hypothetical protein